MTEEQKNERDQWVEGKEHFNQIKYDLMKMGLRGQYVIIFGKKIYSFGPDEKELVENFYRKEGYKECFVAEVPREKARAYEYESPEFPEEFEEKEDTSAELDE